MAKVNKLSPNTNVSLNGSLGLNASMTNSPNGLNMSDKFKFLMPDKNASAKGRYSWSPMNVRGIASPKLSPIAKKFEIPSPYLLKRRDPKDKKDHFGDEKARHRGGFNPAISIDKPNKNLDTTLSVRTVLKDLEIPSLFPIFEREELFRKLSLSNINSTESPSECRAKYRPQKDHSITISPTNGPAAHHSKQRTNRKKDHRKHKNKSNEDDDDDFTVTTGEKQERRSYIKNCIKKRLNNNYEKQINCHQDENMVFTDNKIYISLAARNSSISSSISGSNSLKKNRRIIYPTSGGYKITGFLRDYDFNYESPTKTAGECSSAGSEENLKFNVMKETSLTAAGTVNNIVFEKVKIPTNKSSPTTSETKNARQSCVNVTNECDDRNDDSILTSTTFVAEWNHCDLNSYEADDEDDVQWKNFLELRKHEKSIGAEQANGPRMTLSDSGFGSQLLSNSSTVDKNLKSLEAWCDDETFDNSFNEELEQRVSVMFPGLMKDSHQTAYYNNINNSNHEKREKFC